MTETAFLNSLPPPPILPGSIIARWHSLPFSRKWTTKYPRVKGEMGLVDIHRCDCISLNRGGSGVPRLAIKLQRQTTDRHCRKKDHR